MKIAPDGEILTRGPHVMKGYYKKPEATAEAIDADGWFHTGDVGFLEDGFLTITDRKKDIIVTSGGKNIAPQPIEGALKPSPLIAEAVMIGNKRNFASALVVPKFDALEKWAAARGISFRDREELVRRPEIVAHYEQAVKEATGGLRALRADQEDRPAAAGVLAGGRGADAHPQGEAPRGGAEVQGRDRPHVRGARRRADGRAARSSEWWPPAGAASCSRTAARTRSSRPRTSPRSSG